MKSITQYLGGIIIVLATFSIPAKSQQTQSPADYYKYITIQQTKVTGAITEYTNNLNSGDEVLKKSYDKCRLVLKSTFEEINKKAAYKNETDLKVALVSWFGFYNQVINKEYKEIYDLFIKKDFSKLVMDRVDVITNDIALRETGVSEKLLAGLKSFGAKYNVEIPAR
jgi:hypothetical protein